MTGLPARVLHQLARSRLGVRQAVASTGIGERPSKAKGVGIEFADHRAYQMGDDIRHLDRHLHARLGSYYVRQYTLYRQLPVVVLVDASRSMAFGRPPKLPFAASLAAAFSYVGLAGGDRVQLGAFAGDEVRWAPPMQGLRCAPELFGWLERLRAGGDTRIDWVLRAVLPRLRPDGLLVVLSDWMFDGVDEALTSLAAARQELVSVQVLAPEEFEPHRLGSGDLHLIDSETGHEVEVGLDAAAERRYRAELDAWVRDLRERHARRQWLFLEARSDDNLEQILTVEWRRLGLIT